MDQVVVRINVGKISNTNRPILSPSKALSIWFQDPYVSIHWYNAVGEEKEVCFDNVQGLAKFLRENPGLAEKVGDGQYDLEG